MQASSGLTAWTAHLLLLKLVLWLLGVPSAVPLLEAVCYTGYPIVLVCINTVVVAVLGKLCLTMKSGYISYIRPLIVQVGVQCCTVQTCDCR